MTSKFLISAALSAACVFLLAQSPAPARWDVNYFYDQADSTLTITDFRFPSAQRGIASGYISKKVANLVFGDHEKDIPVVLVTANGGKNWEQLAVKEVADSLFFLNDTLGWLVSPEGIWASAESGRTWKRVSSLKNLTSVYFLTATHGFAAGSADRVLETQDGGVNWKPITSDTGATPPALGAVYRLIAFSDSMNGIVAGDVPSRELISTDVPIRMLRPHKQVSSFLHTKDGGKTWRRAINPMYGEMTRTALLTDGTGLALLQFPQAYTWPSEVFSLQLSDDRENHSLYRVKNRAITDVLATGEDSYIAGYEPPGDIHPSPIPGKVKILHSLDRKDWREMPVDYRAVAREVWLASPKSGDVWAATDTGMILKLTSQR